MDRFLHRRQIVSNRELEQAAANSVTKLRKQEPGTVKTSPTKKDGDGEHQVPVSWHDVEWSHRVPIRILPDPRRTIAGRLNENLNWPRTLPYHPLFGAIDHAVIGRNPPLKQRITVRRLKICEIHRGARGRSSRDGLSGRFPLLPPTL